MIRYRRVEMAPSLASRPRQPPRRLDGEYFVSPFSHLGRPCISATSTNQVTGGVFFAWPPRGRPGTQVGANCQRETNTEPQTATVIAVIAAANAQTSLPRLSANFAKPVATSARTPLISALVSLI